jgi:stress-induced morphogen
MAFVEVHLVAVDEQGNEQHFPVVLVASQFGADEVHQRIVDRWGA